MLRIEGARHRFCDGISRRSFWQIGGLAMGGLTLPASASFDRTIKLWDLGKS